MELIFLIVAFMSGADFIDANPFSMMNMG